MPSNPFTPSEIAALPEQFFGRDEELNVMERSIAIGSVAIQGAMGIGKSSLLAHIRLRLEGFNNGPGGKSILAVGDRDILTIDDAARLLLERFVSFDEAQNSIRVKVGSVFEWESKEICNYFKAGRHFAALERIVQDEALREVAVLVLAIDEADKCPIPIARLIRKLTTHVQHEGVRTLRFLLAGVSPFVQAMIKEDAGIARFLYKTITVLPLPEDDAYELVETKFHQICTQAEETGLHLELDDTLVTRIVQLSGGHPHLLQLLGSHVVEHEDQNPDGVLDAKDLANALTTICYEDRARVYHSLIYTLELEQKLEPLKRILQTASSRFPTRINREIAENLVDHEVLEWFVANNFLTCASKEEYSLTDEFLRIRMLMDDDREQANLLEQRLLASGAVREDNLASYSANPDDADEEDAADFGEEAEDFDDLEEADEEEPFTDMASFIEHVSGRRQIQIRSTEGLKACAWCRKRLSTDSEIWAMGGKASSTIKVPVGDGVCDVVLLPSMGRDVDVVVPRKDSPACDAGCNVVFVLCSEECCQQLQVEVIEDGLRLHRL